MAKCEMSFPPYHTVDPDVQSVLSKCFSTKDIDRLTTQGGRVTIVLAFGAKKKATRQGIDSQFVEFVRKFEGSEKELRDRLDTLTIKELKSICKELEIPFRSDARASELLSNIASFVTAPRKWDKIMGQPSDKQ